tara:strand:+ start:2445 stop:2642 length:198 start_codon:yes stop_codon:yes gene_type:complete
MSWLQIAASAGVVVFVIAKAKPWQHLAKLKKSKDPLETTLRTCAPLCESQEDFKAWKRMIDLASK